MFKNLANQLANYYNWLDTYSEQVVFEYNKFMELKNNYNSIIPPDEINKCWQFHILSTESYNSYCMTKFNKFIHYNLDKVINKEQKINETIEIYKKVFYAFKYPIVWSLSTKISSYEHLKLNNIKLYIKDNILLFSCTNNDTIKDLKHIIGLKYNLNTNDIKISFSNKNDIYNNNINNIPNICHLYKLNKISFLPDCIHLINLYNYYIKELIVN